MAHQLEVNEQGEARMFYAGKAPWHGLGTAVEKEITSTAAMKLAGLDWKVEKSPVYAQTLRADVLQYREVSEHKIVMRTEDQAVLGLVGDSYELIQNEEAFGFLDSLVGEGLAMYNTAGSLFGGRRVFCCCKLPDSVQIGPDQVDKYLVAIWGHNGSMAYHIKWTPIRVVCWNTASAAFQIKGGKVQASDCVTLRHTKHWRDHAKEAREVLNLTQLYYKRLEECFQKLIATPLRESDFSKFASKLYPDSENDKGGKIDRSKQRQALKELFHHGMGNDHPDVKGTRWAAYNAVTEYIDHHKQYYAGKTGGIEDTRMNSVIWGQGADFKKTALDLLAV